MFSRVLPNQGEQMLPMGIVAVVLVHDLDLPKMNSFAPRVDVRGRLVIKPQLGLGPTHVGDLGVAAHGTPLAFWIDDVVESKVPFFDRLAQRGENPVRNLDVIHFRTYRLENTTLNN